VAELEGRRGGRLLAGEVEVPEVRRYLKAALGDPQRCTVVGLIDDVCVGMAHARLKRAGDLQLGGVEVIYVEAPARRVGVGSALLEQVSSWASLNSCVGVDVPVLPGDRAGKAFLESAGFVARLLVMHSPTRTSPRRTRPDHV
jgi:GNAT superfamily N-acetyltransferase